MSKDFCRTLTLQWNEKSDYQRKRDKQRGKGEKKKEKWTLPRVRTLEMIRDQTFRSLELILLHHWGARRITQFEFTSNVRYCLTHHREQSLYQTLIKPALWEHTHTNVLNEDILYCRYFLFAEAKLLERCLAKRIQGP